MCTKFYPWCSVAILPQRVFKHPAAKFWATSKIYHEDKHLGAAVEFWVSRWLSWKKKWEGLSWLCRAHQPISTPEIWSEKKHANCGIRSFWAATKDGVSDIWVFCRRRPGFDFALIHWIVAGIAALHSKIRITRVIKQSITTRAWQMDETTQLRKVITL